MKYSVTGADKNTGDEHTIIISATDEKDAERQARGMGMLASVVLPRGEFSGSVEQQQPEPTKEQVAAALAKMPPDYAALKVLAILFRVNAAIGYVLGIAIIAFGAISIVAAVRTEGANRGMETMLYGITLFVEGLISHGIAEFFLAFRDLVRNSFRI